MCKTKMATNASDPTPARPTQTHSPRPRRTPSTPAHSPRPRRTPSTPAHSPRPRRTPSTPAHSPRTPSYPTPSTSADYAAASSSSSQAKPSSSLAETTTTYSSSRTSLTSLRESISESPHLYSVSEIRSATNNFLSKKHSSSSSTSCWRCVLRGRDVIIFQRRFRRNLQTQDIRERLSVICRSHHNSIIKLLGASISDDSIYLVYDYINGANLSDCLRNSRNPEFTVLSSWMSRMQIATDLAHGLDYIHNNTGLNLNLVHNHIKSSSIIVTEPSFNAKICHFGTAQLCGETDDDYERRKIKDFKGESEISEEIVEATPTPSRFTRSSSGSNQFEGVRDYMSPEFRATGIPTQKSDVYAVGVVILELLCGEEPFKYKYDRTRGELTRTSVIDTARMAMGGGDDDNDGGREGRLRKWVDRRLRDSFPVDVAERVTRVALECVDVDPDKRPDMGRVSRKISKLYLASRKWSDSIKMPTGISLSLAPRS